MTSVLNVGSGTGSRRDCVWGAWGEGCVFRHPQRYSSDALTTAPSAVRSAVAWLVVKNCT
jgi:hypothetical protein